MDWSPDWNLRARMVLAVVLLVVLGVEFVGVVTALLAAAASLVGLPFFVAPALASLLLVGVAVLELGQRDHVVREAGAVEVDAETAPRLHRTVTNVAQQADVQVPALAVAKTATPEAFTAGFRPNTTTLAVSTGLLDELDDRELRAVVAHELAHVKNRDVAVMTAVSLPTVIAERLYDLTTESTGELTLEDWEYRRSEGSREVNTTVGFVVAPLGGLFAFVGRLLVGVFSQSRELAADRGAVTITGDPAALASALATIEHELDSRPSEDLRATASVSAFSIVSPTSTQRPEGPVRLGPEGETAATYHYHSQRIETFLDRFVRTHPPVADRRERLKRLAREQ